MEIVRYSLADIELAMVDFDGELFCSTPQLCQVFQTQQQNLAYIVGQYKEEFTNSRLKMLTTRNLCSKKVLDALLLERSRPNTRIWTEDDVLAFTFFLRNDIARQCRAEFKDILKQHAVRNHLTQEQVEMIVAAHTGPLKAQLRALQENMSIMGSYAGKQLQTYKSIVH